MKIVNNENKSGQFFQGIPAGTVFKAKYGGICIKLAYQVGSSVNAVDLNNNDFRAFDKEDVVKPFFNAELHLND